MHATEAVSEARWDRLDSSSLGGACGAIRGGVAAPQVFNQKRLGRLLCRRGGALAAGAEEIPQLLTALFGKHAAGDAQPVVVALAL